MPAQITLTPAHNTRQDNAPWGHLRWFADAALGNSEALTVGQCSLPPGNANPRHRHPNCEEVLVVLQGEIEHTGPGDQPARMRPGDAVTIPAGLWHNARNVGNGEAILLIAFSSAHRQTELDPDSLADPA
ncbi:MAG: cupin domain-containing protein [Opitutales bacterium]